MIYLFSIETKYPSLQPYWVAKSYGDQCVNGQSNGLVKFRDNVEKCVRKLDHNANLSNGLMNTSGGDDNFEKSFCYIIEQVWVPDRINWRIILKSENRDIKIHVTDWDSREIQEELKRIDSNKVHWSLGYHLNIST